MANKENCIKVTKLPKDITEDEIKIIFQNKRNQGGGPIQTITLDSSGGNPCAFIHFRSSEAVDTILARGSTVTINEQIVHVAKHTSLNNKKDVRQAKAAHLKNKTTGKVTSATTELLQTQDKKAKINKISEHPPEKSTSSNFDSEEDIHQKEFELTVKSTIKATVNDVWKSKDFYIFYLEDPQVSQGCFEESSLLLDCLNKVLYVTFVDEEGAIRTCQQKHGRDSNFAKVEIATEADFETYPNKVLVHGFDLKDLSRRKTFLDFVYRETRINVQDVIQWKEPRSAILVFDEEECQDVTEICWKLRVEYNGIKILTAPVFKTKTVSVSGLPSKFDKCLLQRYLSNRRSGGGAIDSLVLQNKVAIVRFKEEEHFFGVLNKKDHCLEDHQLKIEPYYDCLSTSAFKRSLSMAPSQEQEMDWINMDHEEQSEDDEAEFLDCSTTEEYSIDLEKKDIILLQNTEFLKQFKQEFKMVKITIDTEKSKAKGRGDSPDLLKAMAELLKRLKHFKSEKLNQFSKYQLEVLKKDCLRNQVNEEFGKGKKQAVLVMEDNDIFIHYIEPTSIEDLSNRVKKLIHEETRKWQDPNTRLLFTSKQGQEFLSSLCKKSDGSPLGILIKYNEHDNSLLIVAAQEMRAELHQKIDAFLKENVIDVKNVKISEGKVKFIDKYKKNFITSLKQEAKSVGVMIKESPNNFEVRGKRDEVEILEKKLIKIRDSIFTENFILKLFGIKEFMSERDGKLIKTEVESRLACCILLPSDSVSGGDNRKSPSSYRPHVPMKPVHEPQTVATAELDGYTLHFMQGDLLGLKVEAIINPVDENKQLSNIGNLCKAILSRGGDQIQTELMKTSDSELVTVTGSGNLGTCQHILHVVLQKFNSGGSSGIKTAVTAVLNCAIQRRFSAVGFPCLGSGQIFGYPNLTVSMQTLNAIKDHIESGAVSPVDIYLCDKSDEMLSSLIDRCEQTFPEAYINRFIELQQKPKAEPVPKPRRSHHAVTAQQKNFGHLKVKLHKGEITKWKTDAIAIAVDKSLDLKKGTLAKLVLRHGGENLQQELNDNYVNGIQHGKFAQSTGGNLKCEHIFYACVSHWKGENGPQAQQMQKLVEEMLEGANSIPVTSIALPALGTGNLKYPSDVVATVFSGAVSNFARNNPSSALKNIDFVIYSQDTEVYNSFQQEMMGAAASPAKPVRSKPKDFLDDEEDDDDDDDDDENEDNNAARSKGAFGRIKSAFGNFTSLFKGDGNKIKYGPVTLSITKGDITQENCGAIVCSIKNSMDLSASGAVCKNLLKKCGSSLQAECDNQKMAMQQTGVAMTSASNLPCQNIYFVSMEKFSSSWDKGVLEVLNEAGNGGVTSIALPLLGSGAKNPNMDMIKKRFLAGVEKYGKSQNASLKDIRLVIFSQEMYDFFVAKTSQSSSPSKQDIITPKETYKPKHKVSDEVVLKLYANDASHADKIKKDLIQNFKNKFATYKMEEKKIKQLSPEQVHEIEKIAWENRVQVKVLQEEGVVLLKSFFPFTKVITKLSSLMLEAVENHHIALHKASPTAIVWQYQDTEDKWRNFEPLVNAEIEKEYRRNKYAGLNVEDSKGRKYHLDFKAMEEIPLKQDGSLDKHGIKIRRFDKTRSGEPLPKRWESMGPTENMKLVQLKSGGEEYNHVEALFNQGGAGVPIKTIQRIQNKSLYQQYMVKKREMDLRNGKGFQNEKRLFHGTSPTSMAAINENGFSNNYSGVNATAYGEGSYFAVQSSYSVRYSQADISGLRHMYVVRVLVGKSTNSRSGMKYLPNQPGTSTPFDSGTDGNNVMYIIFHDAQTYPEYLISF